MPPPFVSRGSLTPDDLVSMRIHRVPPRFIRALKEAGYEHVPVEKMVQMKVRRIQPSDLNPTDRDQRRTSAAAVYRWTIAASRPG